MGGGGERGEWRNGEGGEKDRSMGLEQEARVEQSIVKNRRAELSKVKNRRAENRRGEQITEG